MKTLLKFFAVVFCLNIALAQDREIAVQGMHAEGASQAKVDNTRNLLVSYGYKDETLKFWNKDSGTLLHTEDLEGFNNDLEINVKEGKTYVLINNTIIVYSNDTFKELKRYPLGRIYAMFYNDTEAFSGLLVYAQDSNGLQAMYSLDESTGNFIPAEFAPFNGEGEINHFELNSTNTHMWISTNYLQNYVYNFVSGKSFVTKDYVLELMDDGDVIIGSYNFDEKNATYYRYNLEENDVQWEQTLPATLPYATATPFRGDVSLNTDGKSMWTAPGSSLLVELEANSGYIMGKIYREEDKRAMLADGDFLYVQSGTTNPYAKFKRYEKDPIVEYGYNLFEPNEISCFRENNEKELVVADYYGKPYSFLFNEATTRFTGYNITNDKGYQFDQILIDQSSKNVYSLPNSRQPMVNFKRGEPNSTTRMLDNIANTMYYDLDSNKGLMASLSNSGLRIVDVNQNKEVFLTLTGSEAPYGSHMIDLSPTGNYVVYGEQLISGDEASNEKMVYLDYLTKENLWQKDGRYTYMEHIEGGNSLLVVNADKNQVEILDPKTGTMKRSFAVDSGRFAKMGHISPNEDYIVFTGYDKPTTVYNISSGQKVNEFKDAMFDYFDGSFVTNEIVAVSASGAIKFVDMLKNKEVLRVYIFQDNEWLAHTKDGLFDGSAGAWDRVSFSNGSESIPLEQVFDNFYTPRLMHKILNGGEIDKPKRDIKNLKKAPIVEMTYKEGFRNLTVEDDTQEKKATITTKNGNGEVILNANAKGDVIKELRLYQNGKLLNNNTRNLIVEDDVAPQGNTKSYKVRLVEGANEFVAIAINSQQTESRPERLTVIYKPVKEQKTLPGITAHVMIVGINSYKNPKYDLNYAVADATSFMDQVNSGMKNITSNVKLYEVKNSDAVRQNILDKFTEIASTANPQDIFIFYYAGHGMVTQDEAKEFYLVPHDVTQVYGDDGSMKQKGISASELKQISSGIPAQKQLFVLDACQSAGALNAVATRGASEEKAIAQLARSTGTHWLTASGSEQFATEFDELGHGVFTYALLEALSGKADSGDGRITVNELKAYIESQVPELSAKYKGSPQYPSSFGFGQDFPISVNN